jgi:hypothetical protein
VYGLYLTCSVPLCCIWSWALPAYLELSKARLVEALDVDQVGGVDELRAGR